MGLAVADGGQNMIAMPERIIRSKNVFKNNLKAIKSSFKTAANFLPNIFNRSNNNNNSLSAESKKSKTKLYRNDSLCSSVHSNSFYSSVLGSENSNSQFTSNSYSTNNSKQYSNQKSTGTGASATKTDQSLNRCNSYDPISIDGSSRQSSEVSINSLVASSVCGRRTQEAKHLKQTDNLVIQPQSLALSTDQQYSMPQISLPVVPNQMGPFSPIQPNNQMPISNTVMAPTRTNVDTTPEEEALNDSMNNLIFPDDMVMIDLLCLDYN